MRDETRHTIRVGMLAATALVLLGAAILLIGKRQQLLSPHLEYHTSLANVEGLTDGAAVNMDGVKVGFVKRITLPRDPANPLIRVTFSVQKVYDSRIRQDTRATVKTLGLLGEKYLALTAGSADQPPVPPGGLVQGQSPPEISQFLAGGEDLMDNLLAISASLRVILQRVEAGEGLLGDLTRNPEHGEPIGETMRRTLDTTNTILDRIEKGQGLLGMLVTDDPRVKSMLAELEDTVRTLRQVSLRVRKDMDNPESTYAALMRDPEGRKRIEETLEAVHEASLALEAAAEELSSGQGTLPRLLSDRKYADDFLGDLEGLMAHLRSVSAKLDEGQGTAGAFINDPQIYQDLENVVRGVKSSKVMSWFIRNRRKKGEEIEEKAQPPDDTGR